MNKKSGKALMIGSMIIIGLITIFSMVSCQSGATGFFIGIILLGIVYGGCYGAKSLLNFYIQHKGKEIIKLIEDYQEKNNQLKSLEQSIHLDFIPKKYRTIDALRFFEEVLQQKRAQNLAQAINLYEEEKHRREVIRLQKEQIEMQVKQIDIERKRAEAAKANAEELADDEEKTLRVVEGVITAGAVIKAGHTIAKAIKSLK